MYWREDVRPIGLALPDRRDTGAFVGEGDLGAGHGSATLVRDSARNRSRVDLPSGVSAAGQDEHTD
jgi:hypothetical protein